MAYLLPPSFSCPLFHVFRLWPLRLVGCRAVLEGAGLLGEQRNRCSMNVSGENIISRASASTAMEPPVWFHSLPYFSHASKEMQLESPVLLMGSLAKLLLPSMEVGL